MHGALDPQAIVLHRTYGAWGGDYSVGHQGIFHFLLGKDQGRWVQFAPTEIVQYHCNGANFRAVGIEIEGTNDDALTDWQSAKLGDVLHWLHAEHGIPLDYLDPNSVAPASVSVNHSNFRGVISHVSVATDDGSSQHTDEIPVAAFQAAIGNAGPAPAPGQNRSDDVVFLEETGTYWVMGLGDYVEIPQAVGLGVTLNGGTVVPVKTIERVAMGIAAKNQATKFLKGLGVG